MANPSVPKVQPLLEWVWAQPDDVLVLTELGRGQGSRLIEQVCRASGFSVEASDPTQLGVLVAGRHVDIRPDPATRDLPPLPLLPGRVQAAVVENDDPLRILAVYGAASDPVRYASQAQRQRKRDWLAAFVPWVGHWMAAGPGPAVVLGDLNIVDPGGTRGLKYVLAEEVAAYHQLTGAGLVDAFRLHHPHDHQAVSWVDHTGAGCRYDHAFVVPSLAASVRHCELLDDPRRAGLTDHSALRLDLRRPTAE